MVKRFRIPAARHSADTAMGVLEQKVGSVPPHISAGRVSEPVATVVVDDLLPSPGAGGPSAGA